MTITNENEIPKQYDPVAAQKKWSKFWEEKGLFRPDLENKSRNGAQRNDGNDASEPLITVA